MKYHEKLCEGFETDDGFADDLTAEGLTEAECRRGRRIFLTWKTGQREAAQKVVTDLLVALKKDWSAMKAKT